MPSCYSCITLGLARIIRIATLQGVGAFKSVNQTIQRLEEAAVSYRGHERALLITRWLSVLKEIDRATESSAKDKQMTSDEQLASDEAKRREWIIEPPHDEEVTLLLEIFGLCLNAGKKVHDAIVSSMQDLATVFSSYKMKFWLSRTNCFNFPKMLSQGLKISAEILK